MPARDVRSFEGRLTAARTRFIGDACCERRTMEVGHGARSVVHHSDHTFLYTVAGGAERVRVGMDGAEPFVGPKLPGNCGFTPAQRRNESDWPLATLTYMALFVPHASLEQAIERPLSIDELAPVPNIEDDFSRVALATLADIMSRDVGPVDALLAEAVATALQLQTLRLMRIGAAENTIRNEPIDRAIEFIEANLGGTIAIDGLAALIGLPRARLAEAFRRRTGMTPHAYVTKRRIERAKRELIETDMPIGLIATSVGCADASHLTLLFRKHLGTSPRAYRHYFGGRPDPHDGSS